MIKKTISYLDFDGKPRTEDCYFGFTETEIMEKEVEHEEGLTKRLERLIDKGADPDIMKEFKQLILDTYGEKSPDGRHFMKSPEISERFRCTQMYNELYMELISDPEKASEFIAGIIPKEKTDEQKKMLSQTNYERLSAELQKNGNVVSMPTAPVTE